MNGSWIKDSLAAGVTINQCDSNDSEVRKDGNPMSVMIFFFATEWMTVNE